MSFRDEMGRSMAGVRERCEQAWMRWKHRRYTRANMVGLPASDNPLTRPASRQEVLQWITQSKWFLVDQLEQRQPQPRDLQCPLCGCRRESHHFAMHESYCQFGGGRLLRHECPDCHVIFGPSKVMNLSEQELAEEYRMLYETYSEHDTTENEIRTFHAMKPRRNGIYLNFGSGGAWNSAIQKLRAEGWDLYGYEPYAAPGGEHIIRDPNHLKQLRFDGIMSNNLLEHLPNPLATFQLWRSLLRSPSSVMAHSTPCYEYRYAFTRFHLFFFTGDSLNVLGQRTGFSAQKLAEEGDYICYGFTPLAESMRAAA